METVKIGGRDIELELKYHQFEEFLKKYQIIFEHAKQLQEKGQTYNWNMFIFWTVWECIKKKGFWPFKKPFRSQAHMIKSILFEEYADVTQWVTNKVLGTTPKEGKESKNPRMQVV